MDSDLRVTFLNYLSNKITLYCPIIIIVIGTIGCLCDFITFTSRKLRNTSCSIYFLGAAIFDLLTLDFGTLTRLLSDHFGYNAQDQSRIYCKIRLYLINVLPAVATCFIVLAVMDRFMSTSVKLFCRSLATIRNAKWIAASSFVICILSYLHYVIFADLRPLCSLQKGTYSVFTIVYAIVWTSFIPHFLMLCFGFGTHHHIHMTRRRIILANNHQRRLQRTQAQLITMMLFQVGISCLLIFTRLAYYSYNVITSTSQKTTYQEALDSFFAQLTTQLFYLNYAKSFYLYTLCSKYFRNIFVERIRKIYLRLSPFKTNNINRVTPNSHAGVNIVLQTRSFKKHI